MTSEAAPKRRGRPPKGEGERKSGNLTIRTYGPLREQLEEAARQSGRSVSAEVEHRLERSFWEEAVQSHEKEESARFGPDAYLSRLERECGGPAGLSFAVTLGHALRRLRSRLGVSAEADVLDLPEDQRKALMDALVRLLPVQFNLWDDTAANAAADLLGLGSKE